jgi:hypothetical protein
VPFRFSLSLSLSLSLLLPLPSSRPTSKKAYMYKNRSESSINFFYAFNSHTMVLRIQKYIVSKKSVANLFFGCTHTLSPQYWIVCIATNAWVHVISFFFSNVDA